MDNLYMMAMAVTGLLGLIFTYSLISAKKKRDRKKKREAAEHSGATYRTITSTVDGKVAILTLDRPRKKNAFSKLMYRELEKAIRAASADKEIKVIMLTGNGDYYSSGNDLSNFSELKHPLTIAKEAREVLFSFVDCFITCEKPIIVAVNGPAIGIAVTSLGLCDKVFAGEKATFRTPFAALGQSPEGCSSFLFPKIMGEEVAGKVLGEGAVLDSQEALQCRLIHCVLPEKELLTVVTKYCQYISTLPSDNPELIRNITKESLLEKLKAVNLQECEELEVVAVSKKCFSALAAYLESRNMIIAGFMLRFANFTGFLWGQPR